MTKVKFLVTLGTLKCCYIFGQEYDLPDSEAAAHIKAKQAVKVEVPKPEPMKLDAITSQDKAEKPKPVKPERKSKAAEVL
jgi:hypothetical protein